MPWHNNRGAALPHTHRHGVVEGVVVDVLEPACTGFHKLAVKFLGIFRTSWHRVASRKSVMVGGFIEIYKHYKPGLLSSL